jgi:hypothetical protein
MEEGIDTGQSETGTKKKVKPKLLVFEICKVGCSTIIIIKKMENSVFKRMYKKTKTHFHKTIFSLKLQSVKKYQKRILDHLKFFLYIFLAGKSMLATPLLMSPILFFLDMSGFEPRAILV